MYTAHFVDTPSFIHSVMTSGSPRYVFICPQEFEKTRFLKTLKAFLDVTPAATSDASHQQSLIFNLENDKAFCETYKGQFPVLSMSLKTVTGSTFADAQAALVDLIASLAAAHAYLLDSPRLRDDDKRFLQRCLSRGYLSNPANVMAMKKFPSLLTIFLAKHFVRRVVLLIDDWDVPLRAAAEVGFYPEMLDFMESFLSFIECGSALTIRGLPILKKTVLMGYGKVKLGDLFVDTHYFDVRTITL